MELRKGSVDEILNFIGSRSGRVYVLDHPVVIGSDRHGGNGKVVHATTPINGSRLAVVRCAGREDAHDVVLDAQEAFEILRVIPAPKRGEFIRKVGNKFRENKEKLAELITLEVGKIYQESLGEVQEVIDVCDFAVGLSRQLYGKTIVSERPYHRLTEQWLPLGPIGVISAFNFPMAVWAWNAAIAIVCGDPVIWKPSEKSPLCALACQDIIAQVIEENAEFPPATSSVIIGEADVGDELASNNCLPLISATGSVSMGRKVAKTVGGRLGKTLLELGGNNAMIVTPSADLELAVRAIVFSAVGTCGQRCTTLRRLIVHKTIARKLMYKLTKIYEQLPIGDPMDENVLVGPLIDHYALCAMNDALESAKKWGGVVHCGGAYSGVSGGAYARPALVEFPKENLDGSIVQTETFAPILYVMEYETIKEAIDIHNNVPQGLSSAIFTGDVNEAELFCSASGSDCGIVNVNIGTSGAEIGGAFGGEKDTGGGRESGSDSWKAYMRRATNTVNFSDTLPLAQGIKFDV